MTIKEIQTALKENGINRKIAEIDEFLQKNKIDTNTESIENIVKAFQSESGSLAATGKSQKMTRNTRSHKKIVHEIEKLPEENNTHDAFHDIQDESFQSAVNAVAQNNLQKAVLFPQAVAQKTYQLLQQPENQQILQASLQNSGDAIELMMYGFNPSIGAE